MTTAEETDATQDRSSRRTDTLAAKILAVSDLVFWPLCWLLAFVLRPFIHHWWARNIPNAMSIARLPLSGYVAWKLYYVADVRDLVHWILAGSLLVLSDRLDGMLARELDVVSKFGARIDPASDKALVLCIWLSLCLRLNSPVLWVATVPLLIAELHCFIFGTYSGWLADRIDKSVIIGASVIGKVKMGAECVLMLTGWSLVFTPTIDLLASVPLTVACSILATLSAHGYYVLSMKYRRALRSA